MNKIQQSRKTNLFIILGSIFLTNAILAEIIGVKIFSGEKKRWVLSLSIGLFSESMYWTLI